MIEHVAQVRPRVPGISGLRSFGASTTRGSRSTMARPNAPSALSPWGGARHPISGSEEKPGNPGQSRHPSFVSRPPHPFIRGTQVRCKTTASGQVEHAERQCPTLGKRWVSDIPWGRNPPGRPGDIHDAPQKVGPRHPRRSNRVFFNDLTRHPSPATRHPDRIPDTHPSFRHGLPHPFIRGSHVRRKTTASGHFQHA